MPIDDTLFLRYNGTESWIFQQRVRQKPLPAVAPVLMSRLLAAILHVFAIAAIGGACFPLFLLLLPNIEQSRNEVRIGQAYTHVCRIGDAHSETPSDELFAQHGIPDTDPWGQPYRLVRVDQQQVRAVSSGPNRSSPEVGVDHDDIYSDMPVSPVAAIRAEKDRQSLIAFGGAAALWLVSSAIYVRFFIRRRRKSPSTSPL